MAKSIPIKEFVAMEKAANKAYKRGDFAEVGRINQRFNEIGASLFWQDGVSYILALNRDNPLPFDK